MKLNLLKGAVFTAILLTVTFTTLSLLIRINVPEIDQESTCTHIVDGDTFDTAEGARIRLADVDTPESGYAGYHEASSYLSRLIFNKEVYLDIDDINIYDTWGTRLVCVVYVDYDSTHYLNVNKALLEENLAVIDNYPNEFNPSTWRLMMKKPKPSDMINYLMISLGIGFISTLTLYIMGKRLYTLIRSNVMKARIYFNLLIN